jgi:protein-L-isoaspartate(D-aspartate) O-methyltransferase
MARLGYRNVFVRAGDGYKGWPEEAPFDAIIVTAAAPRCRSRSRRSSRTAAGW